MSKYVTQIQGEPFRFWVESSQKEIPHMVDMLEFNGNGECSCPHFQIRCRSNYRNYDRKVVNHGFPNATRCKHINTVLIHIGNKLVQGVIDELKQNK